MTIILENTNQLEFQTDLSKVIKPFIEKFKKLNWLLTDLDYIILDSDELGSIERLNHEKRAITYTGEELCEIIETRKIQFVWGVFTGFEGKIPEILDNELPFADLNRNLFTEPEKFQIPSAEIEIVCWDSSSTLVKFKDAQLGADFLREFKDGKEIKNAC